MQQVQLECGDLRKIRKCKGSITYCIFGILNVRGIDISLTYDCNEKNLVIHDWYKIPFEENQKIAEEVSTYFETIK